MMLIDPILIGQHVMHEENGVHFIQPHTGAVTLLRTNGKNVLVDTGARGFMPTIQERLQFFHLSPNDIDLIILTHLHLDHAYNVAYFPHARVIAWFHDWKHKQTSRIGGIDGYEPLPGIKIITTPGHGEESISVVAENQRGETVVLAGDSINEVYAMTAKIAAFTYDADIYNQSAKKILDAADVIIPGHGDWFDNPFRKKEPALAAAPAFA